MENKERTLSTGTVIGLVFIVLGILNLFAFRTYKKTSIETTSRLPGILLITIGVIIIIVRMIRKSGENEI